MHQDDQDPGHPYYNAINSSEFKLVEGRGGCASCKSKFLKFTSSSSVGMLPLLPVGRSAIGAFGAFGVGPRRLVMAKAAF